MKCNAKTISPYDAPQQSRFFENRSNINPIEFNKKYAERDQVKYAL